MSEGCMSFLKLKSKRFLTAQLDEKFPGLMLDIARYPRPLLSDLLYTSSSCSLNSIGFYGQSNLPGLACMAFRMGLLAALRSRQIASATGAMMTGSSLGEDYNGIQLWDGSGRALPYEWEHHAVDLIYAESTDVAMTCLQNIVETFNISPTKTMCVVVVCKDLRDSGNRLIQHFSAGVDALGGQVDNFNQRTLPQLQELVRLRNYGLRADEVVYYRRLVENFDKLAGKKAENMLDAKLKFIVDAANSVAGTKMAIVYKEISHYFDLRIVNMGMPMVEECGSEYVLSQRKLPRGIVDSELDRDTICASFNRDGTAIVFYFKNKDGELVVLHGDRIAALAADFIREKLRVLASIEKGPPRLRLGVTQTLSANGGMTEFCQQHVGCGLDRCPPTLHHIYEHSDEYDATVCFDRSGWGTVFMSENASNVFDKMEKELKYYHGHRGLWDQVAHLGTGGRGKSLMSSSPVISVVVDDLLATSQLFTNSGSDSIATFLFVCGVLHTRRWAIESLGDMYRENPCVEVELTVRDNQQLLFNQNYHIQEPRGLQSLLNRTVRPYVLQSSYSKVAIEKYLSRNNILLVAEARTATECEDLADTVADQILDMVSDCGGKRVVYRSRSENDDSRTVENTASRANAKKQARLGSSELV